VPPESRGGSVVVIGALLDAGQLTDVTALVGSLFDAGQGHQIVAVVTGLLDTGQVETPTATSGTSPTTVTTVPPTTDTVPPTTDTVPPTTDTAPGRVARSSEMQVGGRPDSRPRNMIETAALSAGVSSLAGP